MSTKDTLFSKKTLLNCAGTLLDISYPRIVGILNCTPDSFYDGGKYTTVKSILSRVSQMLEEGADIIDVGAYSSRPGAEDVDEKTELHRVEQALDSIRKNYPNILLSIDTFRPTVAKLAIEHFGVNIVNDISAGNLNSEMYDVIAEKKIPYIIMHMKGVPKNMQNHPAYNHLVKEIILFFAEKMQLLKRLGINDIIIDPGFGFGKALEHNYTLLKNLFEFQIFELPIMVGLSRKSMIYKALNITTEQALNGTSALHMLALQNGANFLRVHDVKEAKEVIELYSMYHMS